MSNVGYVRNFGYINKVSPFHQDLQLGPGVLVNPRVLEDPREINEYQTMALATKMRDILVQNAGLTTYSQMGRKVLVVLRSACPEKTSPLFEPPNNKRRPLQPYS